MKEIINYVLIFLAGFLLCLAVVSLYNPIEFGSSDIEPEILAPGDWIHYNQIQLNDNSLIINIENASISGYADTNSMVPTLDSGANGIRIVPSDPEQINIGDIISFGEESIVHRVVDKGTDEEGIYFITKGDNNQYVDGKVRFEDIKYVTIGVLY